MQFRRTPIGGSLYGHGSCDCDALPSRRPKRRGQEEEGAAQLEGAAAAEAVFSHVVSAPLDLMTVLLPVLHCLGSPDTLEEDGVPNWAALGCASKPIRLALLEACCDNPVLLHEWRVLGQRAAGLNLVLREYFQTADRWRRHDLKGKMHKLEPTIVRPRCSILGSPCHVLSLSPVNPPEEFVLDTERQRRVTRVEFSWCAEPGTTAVVQLCKYLKQQEAAPPAASVAIRASSVSRGWQCVRLELDWARRVFWFTVEVNAPGSISRIGSVSSGDVHVSEEHPFGHAVCDGVRYLKVADLSGRVTFAHLQAFA